MSADSSNRASSDSNEELELDTSKAMHVAHQVTAEEVEQEQAEAAAVNGAEESELASEVDDVDADADGDDLSDRSAHAAKMEAFLAELQKSDQPFATQGVQFSSASDTDAFSEPEPSTGASSSQLDATQAAIAEVQEFLNRQGLASATIAPNAGTSASATAAAAGSSNSASAAAAAAKRAQRKAEFAAKVEARRRARAAGGLGQADADEEDEEREPADDEEEEEVITPAARAAEAMAADQRRSVTFAGTAATNEDEEDEEEEEEEMESDRFLPWLRAKASAAWRGKRAQSIRAQAKRLGWGAVSYAGKGLYVALTAVLVLGPPLAALEMNEVTRLQMQKRVADAPLDDHLKNFIMTGQIDTQAMQAADASSMQLAQ